MGLEKAGAQVVNRLLPSLHQHRAHRRMQRGTQFTTCGRRQTALIQTVATLQDHMGDKGHQGAQVKHHRRGLLAMPIVVFDSVRSHSVRGAYLELSSGEVGCSERLNVAPAGSLYNHREPDTRKNSFLSLADYHHMTGSPEIPGLKKGGINMMTVQ